MEYRFQNIAERCVVVFSGRLTFADFGAFKNIMTELSACEGRCVDLDLSGVEFIDSSALGMLMLLRDAVMGRNIPLAIRNARGQVKRIMSMAAIPDAA